MQKDHAKAIKGMSIATLVLSALAILVSLIGIFIISVAGDIIASYPADDLYYLYGDDYGGLFDMSSHNHGYGYGSGALPYGYDLDYEDAIYFAPAILGMFNVLLVFEIICSIATLVASIMGLRLDGSLQRLRTAFVWFIVGAVISAISLGLIATVLFIIMAVFANSDKKLMQGYAQPYDAYGNAPYGNGGCSDPNAGYGGYPNGYAESGYGNAGYGDGSYGAPIDGTQVPQGNVQPQQAASDAPADVQAPQAAPGMQPTVPAQPESIAAPAAGTQGMGAQAPSEALSIVQAEVVAVASDEAGEAIGLVQEVETKAIGGSIPGEAPAAPVSADPGMEPEHGVAPNVPGVAPADQSAQTGEGTPRAE